MGARNTFLEMNMKTEMKSRFFFGLLFFLLIFLCFSEFASGYANVSRSPTLRSFGPRIAVDSMGNLHVVWAEYYTPYTSKTAPPGNGDAFYAEYDIVTQQWSDPVNISNSSLVFSQEVRNVGIAIDSSDNIYVVYVERNRIVLKISSGGIWGDPFEIANSGELIDMPRIGVDSAGNIFTSWWTIGGGIVYSRARIGGNWEDVRTLSPAGLRSKFPNIAVGNNVAYCTWQQGGSERGYSANYARRGKNFNDSWTSSQLVAPTGDVITPDVKIDANDIAHIVWLTVVTGGWDTLVNYAYWTGNGFSSPRIISAQTLQLYPSIYERGGNIYVCWPQGAWGHGNAFHYNSKINGSWSGEAVLPKSAGCTFVDVATSPSQDLVYYVWDDVGKNPYGTWDIWCNLGDTGAEPPPGDEPPIAEFSFSPTTGFAPLAVTFDASASSDPDGTIARYSWNFGDGDAGLGQVVSHIYTKRGTFRVTLTVTDNLGARTSKSTTIVVLSLFNPLNIRWSTHVDESLIQTRTVTEVTWERNPANDALGAQITLYRIYRKLSSENDSAYLAIGEVTGAIYRFIDTMVTGPANYTYTVTALDSQGHESPLGGQAVSFNKPLLKKDVQNLKRTGTTIRY
jgi:PKD repeat protein